MLTTKIVAAEVMVMPTKTNIGTLAHFCSRFLLLSVLAGDRFHTLWFGAVLILYCIVLYFPP